MLRSLRVALFLACATSPTIAQEKTTRAGARKILPREQEIALARSAAPASVSGKARVMVFTERGYVVGEEGASQVTCVVNRSWKDSVEPHCYDAEAAATAMPIELFRNEQRHAGRSEADIDREINAGIVTGKFRLPARPAMTYMMSAAQVLYNDDGTRVGAWKPHLMLYSPYLNNTSLGLPSQPEMRVGMVSGENTPLSSLIVIMPQFVELTSTAQK
jgi:hypothetical protein